MAWGWNTQTHTADKSKHLQLSDPTLASCLRHRFHVHHPESSPSPRQTFCLPPAQVCVYLFSLLWLLSGSSCFTPTVPSSFLCFATCQFASSVASFGGTPEGEKHLETKLCVSLIRCKLALYPPNTKPAVRILPVTDAVQQLHRNHATAVECSHCAASHSELLLDTWLSYYRLTHKSEVVPPDPLRIKRITSPSITVLCFYRFLITICGVGGAWVMWWCMKHLLIG